MSSSLRNTLGPGVAGSFILCRHLSPGPSEPLLLSPSLLLKQRPAYPQGAALLGSSCVSSSRSATEAGLGPCWKFQGRGSDWSVPNWPLQWSSVQRWWPEVCLLWPVDRRATIARKLGDQGFCPATLGGPQLGSCLLDLLLSSSPSQLQLH